MLRASTAKRTFRHRAASPGLQARGCNFQHLYDQESSTRSGKAKAVLHSHKKKSKSRGCLRSAAAADAKGQVIDVSWKEEE